MFCSGSTTSACCTLPYTTLFRSSVRRKAVSALIYPAILIALAIGLVGIIVLKVVPAFSDFYASFDAELDRKSTRLNSSQLVISYAVFSLNIKIRDKLFDAW